MLTLIFMNISLGYTKEYLKSKGLGPKTSDNYLYSKNIYFTNAFQQGLKHPFTAVEY